MIARKIEQRPEPVAQLGDQDVGEEELLGQQERQDGRDPERREQLGEDDLAGPAAAS